ncbi:MAG: branched-chain amino acid ABC transporter permease [Chloroflexota bacterium]|nr:branched-chain amino acid ABC transporter permease [Chloroflexota bacterium]
MPTPGDFTPFFVTGLALGSVYGLSGVGMVVLYRATGVLNLAFGAVGAMGALIAWSLLDSGSLPNWLSYLVCVAFGGVATVLYGFIFGPPLARRDPLVKAVGTLGFALILLGIMAWVWSDKARSMLLPTSNWGYQINLVRINWTQIIALAFAILVTLLISGFLRFTKLGTAMRALADDREISATLGVPVRRVEAAAWFGSGLIAGATGLLLSNLVGLDASTLTFLVISSLAATLIARLESLAVTLLAGIVVGLVEALTTPILAVSQFRDMAPFVLATLVLLWLGRHRAVLISRTAG